ncbi:MAG: malate synthase A [Gammaproteobacteria bacterium]
MSVGSATTTTRESYHFLASTEGYDRILTPAALEFLVQLHEQFAPRVRERLDARAERQRRLDAGELPDFLPETRSVRESEWRVSPVPDDLQDRRVEITGPVDRKMVINALNSGARVYMADFEDANSPTWHGTMDGQENLYDAVRGTIELTTPEGKQYRLKENTATLLVRPRGWHLPEKHLMVHGEFMPAALFDFGLYFFHNAKALLERGTGPYFYLPKLESHLEARLWNDVFNFAQDSLGIKRGTIKATVLIETLLAAFEMDEILYELREHSSGLNCGRWDYIFSFIKCFHKNPEFVLPDRAQVTMTTHFLRSYSQLLIQVCHRRGAHAMGGMAAQIPIKDDPEANQRALEKVRADKEREAGDGNDGTWVAHPGLVAVATEVFDEHMPGPNQLDRLREDVQVTAKDLLQVPEGEITEAGLRNNINVAIQYMASWLAGSGAVPIHHLMEDAATAEIARTQIWQWIRHPKGVLNDGRRVTLELFRQLTAEEMEHIRQEVGDQRFEQVPYQLAARLLDDITATENFVEFLTLVAYEHLD